MMEAIELTSDGPCKLTFESLQRMTDNFSEERILGCGTFGKVYKGLREDGQEIAVKMVRFMPGIEDQQFQNEFKNLKRLKHQNIVRLLGFCDESEEIIAPHNGGLVICERIHRAICLEYMPNGSLTKHLSENNKYNRKNWPVRYRIIKGICKGLKYLHEELEEPILHLDLKPGNILLDQQMLPKISDFGISRLIGEENTRETMSTLGTYGYSPPEFLNSGIISKGFDIFGFGVVTMKIIFGAVGYSSIADINIENQEFIDHAYNSYRKSLQETQDYAFVESECKQIRGCIEIAVSCMDKDRRKRPKIKDIASRFDEIDFFSSMQQHPGTMPVFSNIQEIHMQQERMAKALQPQYDQQQRMVFLQPLSQNNPLQHSQHNIELGFQSQTRGLLQWLESTTGAFQKIISNWVSSQGSNSGSTLESKQRSVKGMYTRATKNFSPNLKIGEIPGSTQFSLKLIKKATKNFSLNLKIGEGGSGTVYKGQLADGTLIAVKRSKNMYGKHMGRKFLTDIETLKCIEHRNLVRFHGYLEFGAEQLIIVEYIPNGNLREHLDCVNEKPIIHRDVKSSNILLTEGFRAKLANFGIAITGPTDPGQSHIETDVRGTAGYVDPEYLRTNHLTTKSDVYSYGILLLEILSGRRPIELRRGATERITVRWAFNKYNRGNVRDILDPMLTDAVYEEILNKIIYVAFQCVAPTHEDRPSMKEVVERLWQIRRDYTKMQRITELTL